MFGVPFSTEARKRFNEALEKREDIEPDKSPVRRALDAHDGYLEVVASRSSGLVGCYSIFLAVLTFMAEGMEGGLLKTSLFISAIMLACSVLMLLPCLWIYWQRDADTYRNTNQEFVSTMRLLYFRSTLFNGSLVLCVLALLVSAFSFGIDKAVRSGWFSC